MLKSLLPVRVGLVGEDPNDTNALIALLERQYAGRIVFIKLGKRLRGDQLETDKARALISDDFQEKAPHFVVVMRDLDSNAADTHKRAGREAWFTALNQELAGRGLFLLHIYELEALIAAHPEVFNAHYGAAYRPQTDVMRILEPKEKLREATRKCRTIYEPEHAAALFAKIDYARLLTRCRYFREFDQAFAARLALLPNG